MGAAETEPVNIERESVEQTIAEDRKAIEAARKQGSRTQTALEGIQQALDDLHRALERLERRATK